MDEHFREKYLRDIITKTSQAGDLSIYTYELIAYHKQKRDEFRKLRQDALADRHAEIVRYLEKSLLTPWQS